MQKAFEYKGLVSNVNDAVLVKDIDEKEGRIRGYFAVFGNVDSDGDVIMPGAFKRTIQNNGKRIKHLWQHDPWRPMAAPEVQEDTYGLLFDSVISKTSYGRDAIQLYVDGVIDEHSIGFNTITQQKSKGGHNELIELKLWEGSSVTWGANEMARTESIKSLTKEQAFDRMNRALKAFRNGSYEHDEIFELLEIYTKQLQQHILDLTEGSTPPATEAPAPQKGLKAEDVLLLNTTLLKTKLSIQTL